MHNVSVSTECEALFKRRLGRAAVWAATALLLLWPAALNRYPLVFSDTGTYLSQIIERHLGWDRPVFYGLAILPLHAGLTTWPVVAAQAVLAAWVLGLVLRGFAGSARLLPRTVIVLALATPLPWVTSELMPDLTTPLVALLIAVLVMVPERLGRREQAAVAALAAALIAMHQSNLPLAVVLLAGLLPLRRWLGATAPLGGRVLLLAGGAPAAALAALVAMNLVGHDRLSPAPYGDVFVLARSLADGPAMDMLRRHCPQSGWRLCLMAHDRGPIDADRLLWNLDSPLYHAGGPKAVAGEAGAILADAAVEEPRRVLRAAATDWVRQLGMVATGDGLQPWPKTVTPVIRRDFPPAEQRRYAAALQTRGLLAVPRWLQDLHAASLVLGSALTLASLGVAARRRHPAAGLCAAVLVCLLGNALVTGALSGPHDRYQSRVAWLAAFAPIVALPALRAGRRTLSPWPGPGPADVGTPTAWSA